MSGHTRTIIWMHICATNVPGQKVSPLPRALLKAALIIQASKQKHQQSHRGKFGRQPMRSGVNKMEQTQAPLPREAPWFEPERAKNLFLKSYHVFGSKVSGGPIWPTHLTLVDACFQASVLALRLRWIVLRKHTFKIRRCMALSEKASSCVTAGRFSTYL